MNNTLETSLRHAVALSQKQPSSNDDIALSLQQNAFSHLDLISQAQGLIGGLKDNAAQHKQAIAMAIEGIQIAYHVLSSQIQEASFQRKQLVDECENYLATFVINKDQEKEAFSTEELAIQYYWELIQKECKSFISYFGIQSQTQAQTPKISRLSIMPYFRMSQALPQKSLILSALEQHQHAIYLFLKTSLPNDAYYGDYKNSSSFFLKMESFWQSHNYLNRIRAPLFIINSLANLLWNLEHPVDINTGISMTLSESIASCKKAASFLNQLLDGYEHSLMSQMDSQKRLKSYLFQIELYIKSLQSAFEYESLHELNIKDVSSSMHRALRIMIKNIIELMYQDQNACEHIVGQLMYLGELLMHSPNLVHKTFPQASVIEALNPIPCTLMDMLILFCHHKPQQRTEIVERLSLDPKKEIDTELARVLENIDNKFLAPFEVIALKDEQTSCYRTSEQQVTIAKQFIPLITMIMASFACFDDTRTTAHIEKKDILSDKKQRELILKNAEDNTYYQSDMSILLKNHSASLDKLLKAQNQMLNLTQLMDEIGSLIIENQILLQLKEFQHMVLDCLKRTCKAYNELGIKLIDIEKSIHHDDTILRNEKRIIQSLLDDLTDTIDTIKKLIGDLSTAMTCPGFTEEQKLNMLEKTVSIQELFAQIFHGPIKVAHDVSIQQWIKDKPPSPKPRLITTPQPIENPEIVFPYRPVLYLIGGLIASITAVNFIFFAYSLIPCFILLNSGMLACYKGFTDLKNHGFFKTQIPLQQIPASPSPV